MSEGGSELNWKKGLKRPLSDGVLRIVCEKLQFKRMTPVQFGTIPQLLACKDVAVEAVTGSGKTLAFLIPILEILAKRHSERQWKRNEIGAIVISPTRELALQTSDVLEKFLEEPEFKFLSQRLLVGGTSVEEDVESLRLNGAQILICTVGRLLDLLERSGDDLRLAGRVKSLEILILDEADRLLDLGFEVPLNEVLGYLPRQRRTGLFSATQTKELLNLMRAGLRNPISVTVKEKANQNTPKLLQNYYMIVPPEQKLNCLLKFIESQSIQKAMLFLPTCACVEYWCEILPHLLSNSTGTTSSHSHPLKILAIHGKMKKKRVKILNEFRATERAILLCTDVMARGVDIPEMDWVLQFDPPSNAAAFVHRVGRTARQGTEGNALILLQPSETAYIDFLSKNQKVLLKQLEEFDDESGDLSRINAIIHNLQTSDKRIFDKGTQAFVSHVKAYSKHECYLILRLKDLDLGRVATSYGLLRLPKMPEMRDEFKRTFIGPCTQVNVNMLQYKNKQKQEAYKAKQDIFQETGEWPGKRLQRPGASSRRSNESWTEAKTKKETRKENRKKRQETKRAIHEAKESGQLAATMMTTTKKRKSRYTQEDLDDLAKDIRAIKRFKRKKISKSELENQMGLNSESDDLASD